DYAGVYITETYEVVQALGNFKKFLQLPDKRLDRNILKMVPDELAVAPRTGVRKATRSQEKEYVNGIKYKEQKELLSVDIIIKPFFEDNKNSTQTILILFHAESAKLSTKDFEDYDYGKEKSDRVVFLEQELKETKELLQATIEEQET